MQLSAYYALRLVGVICSFSWLTPAFPSININKMKKLPDKYKMPRMSYSYDEVPEGMYPYSEKDQQQDTTAQIYNSIVDAFNKKLELIYRDIKD